MEEARRQQVAGPGDDLLITNGCQQALDLIGRVLLRPGDTWRWKIRYTRA